MCLLFVCLNWPVSLSLSLSVRMCLYFCISSVDCSLPFCSSVCISDLACFSFFVCLNKCFYISVDLLSISVCLLLVCLRFSLATFSSGCLYILSLSLHLSTMIAAYLFIISNYLWPYCFSSGEIVRDLGFPRNQNPVLSDSGNETGR